MADYSNDYRISYDERASSCSISFRCFDTPNAVTVYGCEAPDSAVEDMLVGIRRQCLAYHFLWSFSLPGSDLVRINEGKGPVSVNERTLDLLQAMKSFNTCEPTFDFTVGPVSFLWKKARSVPESSVLSAALSHVGAHKVVMSDGRVEKADPYVQIDVGGAAKGYVADAVAEQLRAAGVKSADIDLGGNLFLVGRHPEGRPWRVSVRIPEGVSTDPVVLQVQDKSVVTSGSYERFAEIDGVRYTHIIDATTGWPVASDIVSATVVSQSSLQADMLATTALIAGSEGLAALAARHPDCEFVAITQSGAVMRH